MEDLEKIGLQLKSLHCPMNWKVPEEVELSPIKMIEKLETKLVETEEEGIFKWHKLVLTLLLCSEYYKIKRYDKALEKHKQCEAVMNISDSKGYYEKMFHDSKAALFHVLLACECHILYASGETATLEDKLKEIPKYEDMSKQSKATLLGIQSSISMEYGHEGNQIGLKLIEKAVELNPNEGEWHFLLGRCLVRLRHVEDFTSIPSDKELKAFDRAYSLTANPSYLTFMATAHREAAENVRFSTGIFVKEDYEKSYALYKKALEKTGNCSHVLARCAFGFWKLPSDYKDPELAKECYQKALAIAPKSIMANHIAGKISYMYDKDYEKAKKHLLIAAEGGAYGAHVDLMYMALNQEEGYDPVPHLKLMLKKFPLEPRLSQTKTHLGAVYLFIKDDLSTALDYWMDVINECPDRDILKQYKCSFISIKQNLNVYELIINEVRLALKQKKTNADDKVKFQQALQTCIEKQPELSDLVASSPQSWKEKFSVKKRQIVCSRGKGKGNSFHRGKDEETSNSNWRKKRSNEGRNQELGRSESFNSSCEENVPDNDWRARGRTGYQGKYKEFGRIDSHNSNCDGEANVPDSDGTGRDRAGYEGRTKSHSSSCDSEENLPESDWTRRGRNSCQRGRSQNFERTESCNPKPGCYWRGRGRNSYERGKVQQLGRSKSCNSNCNELENMLGSDQRGRGRGAGQFGNRNVNTNLKGNIENRGSNKTDRVDTSQSRNSGRECNVEKNLNSNWRVN